MEKQIGYVYTITSPTGRIYVGSTVNIKKRWYLYSIYSCKTQRKLYNSLIKHKYENHKFEIVWEGSIFEMYKYETLIGWKFDVLNQENLNCRLPKLGEIYSVMSDETKIKIGNKHKGKTISEEHKNKLKITHLGKKLTQETKNKIGEASKGNKNNLGKVFSKEHKKKIKDSNTGKKHTQESKDRMSKSKKGKKQSKSHTDNHAKAISKAIIQYDKNDFFIKEWESITEASKELKINLSNIISCCKNERKTAGKFKWKYKTKI
jgi:group I intron endonuclease